MKREYVAIIITVLITLGVREIFISGLYSVCLFLIILGFVITYGGIIGMLIQTQIYNKEINGLGIVGKAIIVGIILSVTGFGILFSISAVLI